MYARMGDLAAKVTAQLGGGASEGTETEYPEKLTEGYYRVRKACLLYTSPLRKPLGELLPHEHREPVLRAELSEGDQ